ncbi:MAG: glycosyltransferase family 4 protein [Chitinophagales bacterium]|nr:glycosyltransferase family 4 protein [Chitinophagaceae bacterium]MCB9065384.1 glycosyltransferase family 4 protein [Chitinophagales bacterium]
MRITILPGSVPSTTFIDMLINTMADEGFDVTVVGKQTGAYNYKSGVSTIIVPEGTTSRIFFILKMLLLTGFKHFGKIVGASNRLTGLFNNLLFYLPIIYSKPDKIHIQWTAFIHNRDLLFELYPNKVLVSMRGAHINYTPITTPEIKESYLRLFSKVHRFHAVSNAIAQEAIQYGADIEKTDVIYSCVDDSLLEKPISRKKHSDTLHVISVGRFFWKKGYEYALDALCELKKADVPFKYTLIAEGDTPASIKYQIHQLGLSDYVTIINRLPHDEVLTQIENADVLLLTSVEEGIANVVLEAMGIGTPVITTNVGGMSEVIVDGESGYLVPARDVSSITTTLKKFRRRTPEERYAIAENAKSQIQQHHNRKNYAEQFVRFYKN